MASARQLRNYLASCVLRQMRPDVHSVDNRPELGDDVLLITLNHWPKPPEKGPLPGEVWEVRVRRVGGE